MLTIQYISPKQSLIDVYGDNFGRVFLDVGDFEARLTKVLDQVGDLGQVSQEAGLSGSLPGTNKNKAILEQFRPDTVNRNTSFIPIEVIQDGERVSLTGAIIVGYDEGANEYEFEPFSDDWCESLKELVLADVEAGTYLFTEATILTSWANRYEMAMPMLANYGTLSTPGGGVNIEQLRFWFNVYLLMKQCFCQVGWSFESPHWEGGDGRFLYTFLPNNDEFWYEGKTSPRAFHGDINTPQAFTGGRVINSLPLNEVSDPSNAYSGTVYTYDIAFENVVSFRIVFENIQVQLQPPPAGVAVMEFVIIVTKIRNGIPTTMHIQRFLGSADQVRTITINFEYLDENLIGGDSYQIRTNYRDTGPTQSIGGNYIMLSGDIYFRPNPAVFYPGDTIPLNNLLPSDKTGKDLFEAMASLIGGKVITDFASKTVTLYAPFTYEKQDETGYIEGFYIRNKPSIDLRPNTISDQTSWANEENERDRFRVYGFADSDDAYLQSDEVYKKYVDLKTGINKVKKIQNPLWEPTGEIKASAAEVGGTGDIPMPALWDNDEGMLSENLGPRLCNFYGMINYDSLTWNFNGTLQNEFPYLSQIPTISIPANLNFIPLTFSGFARDLYNLFIKDEIENPRNAIKYQLLITNGDFVYSQIDFRRTILVRDSDSDLELQPISIEDHLVGSKIPLLLSAAPI